MRSCIGTVAVAALALASTPCRAQDDPRILFSGQGGFVSFPIGTALRDLDLLGGTELVFQSEDLLLPALRAGPWDLIIIRWFDAFEGPLAGAIIDELAAHVDGGGKLMFSMAELDEQPELWPILGIDSAVDVVEPLQDIFTVYGRDESTKRHPAFGRLAWRVNTDPPPPPTSDYGDSLVPDHGAFTIAEFADDATGAIVVARDGNVIVNGEHWDYWSLAGSAVAEDQIQWLLECPADLDGDGDLTVFDFLEFQNRFDGGGTTGFADFCYDGRLDVFDFLEYFNLFDAGC